MKKLIIDRKRWLRGGDFLSMLRNSNGEMCCLGFEAMREGVKVKQMCGRFSPQQLFKKVKTSLRKKEILIRFDFGNSEFSDEAMKINDDTGIEDSIREEKLIKLFAGKGIELKFIN